MEKIVGGNARDHRGCIDYVNDFDMSQVKRFYIITNSDLNVVRGWRGHQIEHRWFYVLSGSFAMDLVKIDNWESASQNLPVDKHILDSKEKQVVHISAGYATAFQSLEADSRLLVFADHSIENAAMDDHTWDLNYFLNRNSKGSY